MDEFDLHLLVENMGELDYLTSKDPKNTAYSGTSDLKGYRGLEPSVFTR